MHTVSRLSSTVCCVANTLTLSLFFACARSLQETVASRRAQKTQDSLTRSIVVGQTRANHPLSWETGRAWQEKAPISVLELTEVRAHACCVQ